MLSKLIAKFSFVAHKQKHYTTSLRIFLPLRLYSQLNDFLNTCRKRKTAIDWQQFSFGWYSVRSTQCHSIQSRLHRLECYSSFQPSGAYPLLSVLLLHLAFLPFPLSDTLCRGQALDAPWNGEHFCGDKWYLIKAVCSGHIEPSDKFLSSNHWSSTDKTFVSPFSFTNVTDTLAFSPGCNSSQP